MPDGKTTGWSTFGIDVTPSKGKDVFIYKETITDISGKGTTSRTTTTILNPENREKTNGITQGKTLFLDGLFTWSRDNYDWETIGKFMMASPDFGAYMTGRNSKAAFWKEATGSRMLMEGLMPALVSAGFGAYTGFRLATVSPGITVIGEGMLRVEAAASKIPGARILNDMPKFSGTADQITSQMMQYNRKWILNEMRSGRTILDIGLDVNRANPSIFYQMEQNMLKSYQKLHESSLNIIKP